MISYFSLAEIIGLILILVVGILIHDEDAGAIMA
jgi:hypothetical protein